MEFVALSSIMAIANTIKSSMLKNSQDNTTTKIPLINYEKIVNEIKTNPNHFIPNIKNKPELIENNEEIYNDYSKDVKTLCTTFVTNELLKTNNNMFLFILLIITTFEDAIKEYVKQNSVKGEDIIFLYKSGNILRMITQKFLNYIPEYDIIQDMMEYFKKGDCDFTIYINPYMPKDKFNKIHKDMTILSFCLLEHLREYFLFSKEEYFSYFNYNENYQKEILQRFKKMGNTMECFTDSTSPYYNCKIDKFNFNPVSNQDDKYIKFMEERKTDIGLYNINNACSDNEFIYLQWNEALFFKKSENEFAHFNLLRAKVNFNISLKNTKTHKIRKINVGGELIDVSIPHFEDKKLKTFFHSIKDNSSSYTIRNEDLNHNINELNFTGLSFPYMIYDTEEQVFGNDNSKCAEMPWNGKKYEKRLHRLLFLYFIELFQNKKLKTLADIETYVLDTLEIITYIHENKNYKTLYEKYSKKYDDIYMTNIVKYTLILAKKNKEKDEYLKYLTKIRVDLVKFSLTIRNNINFCSKNNRIFFNEEIYFSSLEIN